MVKIRKATKDDIPILMEIWKKSKYNVTPKKKMQKILEGTFKSKSEVYLVNKNKQNISYFILEKKGKITFLRYIGIIKSSQGKGIGTLIIKKCISIAKKNKSTKMQLNMWAKNFKAIRLYAKFEFYPIKILGKYKKEWGNKILMEKTLK